jgi:hypothetical protein
MHRAPAGVEHDDAARHVVEGRREHRRKPVERRHGATDIRC